MEVSLKEKTRSMERQLPYAISYNTITCWRKIEDGFLWCVFICQITLQLFQINSIKHLSDSSGCIVNILNMLNCFFIILYGIIYIVVEIFMQPMVSNERRRGFIDNSLGTKLLDRPVLKYYDNDSIEQGPYKMLVNCYENCFFTYNIIKVMLPKIIKKNIILFVFLLIFAYNGIKDNIVAIPFLQLFLSSLFLIELIYHIAFFFRLKNLYEKFKQIFSTHKSTKNRTIQDAIYMVLEYETTLAYNKSPISDSVYQKLNDKLTEEWNSIKQNYDIR